MKSTKFKLIVLIIFAVTNNCYAQEQHRSLIDELTFSGNSSMVNDDSTNNRLGIGIGAYHHFTLVEKNVLVTGIEFNHLSQFKNSFFDGESVLYRDVTFDFNVISLRAFPRFKFGHKFSLILEFGPQIDIGIFSHYKGDYAWFRKGVQPGKSNLDEVNIKYGMNIYGTAGIGIAINLQKVDLILKSEYKIGVTKQYDDQNIKHRYLYFTLGLGKSNY